jgi:hypothetical protein
MNKRYERFGIMYKSSSFWIITLSIFIILFSNSLTTTLKTTFQSFSMNETLELDVPSDQNYYLLYNNVLPTDFFDISTNSIYSIVRFPLPSNYESHSLNVICHNTDTNEYVYLISYGENTSIKINNNSALGKYSLEKGHYEFVVSTDSLNTEAISDEFVFTIAPTAFFRNILTTVFLGILMFINIIVLLIVYFNKRRMNNKDIEFDGDNFTSNKSNNLIKLDNNDFFEQYDRFNKD